MLLSEELSEALALPLDEALEDFLWEHADPEDPGSVIAFTVVFLEELGLPEEFAVELIADSELLSEDAGALSEFQWKRLYTSSKVKKAKGEVKKAKETRKRGRKIYGRGGPEEKDWARGIADAKKKKRQAFHKTTAIGKAVAPIRKKMTKVKAWAKGKLAKGWKMVFGRKVKVG